MRSRWEAVALGGEATNMEITEKMEQHHLLETLSHQMAVNMGKRHRDTQTEVWEVEEPEPDLPQGEVARMEALRTLHIQESREGRAALAALVTIRA